jgi:hypothetical protein
MIMITTIIAPHHRRLGRRDSADVIMIMMITVAFRLRRRLPTG